MYICKSTHLFILCPSRPSRPSVARIHTRTFRHAKIYANMHAYATGPVAQWQRGRSVICLQSRGRDIYVQPNSFRGDWSCESSKAAVINWRKYVLCVLVNCLGGIRMPGNSVCKLTDRLRHDRNSVCLAEKSQSNKIHTY